MKVFDTNYYNSPNNSGVKLAAFKPCKIGSSYALARYILGDRVNYRYVSLALSEI